MWLAHKIISFLRADELHDKMRLSAPSAKNTGATHWKHHHAAVQLKSYPTGAILLTF